MAADFFAKGADANEISFSRKALGCPAEQAEKSANPYNQGGQPVLPVPKEISPYPLKSNMASKSTPLTPGFDSVGRDRRAVLLFRQYKAKTM